MHVCGVEEPVVGFVVLMLVFYPLVLGVDVSGVRVGATGAGVYEGVVLVGETVVVVGASVVVVGATDISVGASLVRVGASVVAVGSSVVPVASPVGLSPPSVAVLSTIHFS